ncbi:hypothetical protein EV210_107235 [Anaerospora hongkongensis]|uniref:Uncharacterized protein n=1 Tax=Anaerospora hongkongensis TaxID=244830 RepID=A0A4V2Q8K5_9FIRM|nr:hypothetical protein [Anaerospora hongkongensis]TCL36970.1 hypothetical protein EV210_107235 [Anaerospora hongkongensis]
MSGYNTLIKLAAIECIADIRCECNQLRSRISTVEIERLADGLLEKAPLQWPMALVELQNGCMTERLLQHLQFRVRQYGIASEFNLAFHGPFPTLSLKPLREIVNEHRITLRTSRCIEFVGNKAWNCALKKATSLPLHIPAATWVLDTLECSPKQQLAIARQDIIQRIKGIIINFLHEWENLLVSSIKEQFLSISARMHIPAEAV